MVRTHPHPFLRQADELRERVECCLEQYSSLAAGCPDVLRQAIRHSLLAPGKRLRPLLVLMAAEACGYPAERALPAACAVEMVHTYSLIHDDLPAMDDDDLRRGLPTCHKVFGEANAILAGDALLALAFEILARDVRPAAAAAGCCQALARAAGPTEMVGGQADDLAAEQQAGTGLERLESIHRRKTGAMLRVSLELGAIVADAGDRQRALLDRFGTRLGLAFQIVDDLLDHDGNEQQMGKRVGKDAQRGKLTFPALLGIAASHQRAEQLVGEACEALAEFGEAGEGLAALAQYILERKR
jgi:geranylgeranyl diphosphate synthase type II